MPLLVYYFDSYTMMTLSNISQVACRRFWISLKQSLFPHLNLHYCTAHILKRWCCMLSLGYLWWTLPPALWPGICCGNVQYEHNACYKWNRCQLLQIAIESLVSSVTLCDRWSCISVYLAALHMLLFFCLSLQCNLWLQSHLWVTSMAAGLSVLQVWLITRHGVWVLTAPICAHHLVFLFLIFCYCAA